MIRNWNRTLYLGSMPGTELPLQEWLNRLYETGVSAIVCLNPEYEISLLSPAYRAWRRDHSHDSSRSQFDIPIDDGCAPEGGVVEQFWSVASDVAERCRDGKRTFIHCTAGRGRTGMFGVAVLMILGYSLVDAATELYEVGSYPETAAQDEFLWESIPR